MGIRPVGCIPLGTHVLMLFHFIPFFFGAGVWKGAPKRPRLIGRKGNNKKGIGRGEGRRLDKKKRSPLHTSSLLHILHFCSRKRSSLPSSLGTIVTVQFLLFSSRFLCRCFPGCPRLSYAVALPRQLSVLRRMGPSRELDK